MTLFFIIILDNNVKLMHNHGKNVFFFFFGRLSMYNYSIKKIIKKICIIIREMLTSVLRTLIKNPIKKNFDITFMENKKFVKTLITFFIIFS